MSLVKLTLTATWTCDIFLYVDDMVIKLKIYCIGLGVLLHEGESNTFLFFM